MIGRLIMFSLLLLVALFFFVRYLQNEELKEHPQDPPPSLSQPIKDGLDDGLEKSKDLAAKTLVNGAEKTTDKLLRKAGEAAEELDENTKEFRDKADELLDEAAIKLEHRLDEAKESWEYLKNKATKK